MRFQLMADSCLDPYRLHAVRFGSRSERVRPGRQHFGDRAPRGRHSVLVRHSPKRRGMRLTLGRHSFAPRTEVTMQTTTVQVSFRLRA